MPTSGLTNYITTRDGIILRALRIIGAIGQGETAAQNQTAVNEAAEALNDLVKEWQADGMPLWAIRSFELPLQQGQPHYSLTDSPLKIHSVYRRDNSNPNLPIETPLLILTRDEYERLSSKFSQGIPSQFYHRTPGNPDQGGIAAVYPTPDAYTEANITLIIVGQLPFEYFEEATDIPDFPSYWFNAIKWGLADQLSYEYGLGVTERAQITKKAEKHKTEALSFGTEEGSYYLQPTPHWTEWDK